MYRTTHPTARTLNWDEKAGILTIKEGHKIDLYWITEIYPSPGYGAGRGFELRKHVRTADSGLYHVFVATHGGESSCDCRGFVRWGHCRHLSAMTKLIDLGKLPDPRCNGEQDVGSTETTDSCRLAELDAF